MEIYLIRHTEPKISKGLIYGRLDVPLTESFHEEKLKVQTALPPNIELTFSSPSQRCFLLANALFKKVIADKRLYELNFGEWEGQNWDSIDRKASEYWMEDYINRCPPGGETMLEMKERLTDFWKYMKSLNHQKVAIITHGGVIRVLLVILGKLSFANCWSKDIRYGEVIKVEI